MQADPSLEAHFTLAASYAEESHPAVRLLGYTERAWDDHQDVVVFGRPPVNE